ncbi:TPA: hypothetical protein ACXNIY_002722 [Stenotrophomonas maltophilia]
MNWCVPGQLRPHAWVALLYAGTAQGAHLLAHLAGDRDVLLRAMQVETGYPLK